MSTMQMFDLAQQHLINMGKLHRATLRQEIDIAINNNAFNDNYIIHSLPGLGKSYETDLALQSTSSNCFKIEGRTDSSNFGVDLATGVYLAEGKQFTVVLDDCDSMFNPENINDLKAMFGNSKTFSYNKDIKRNFHTMSDLNIEAVKSFMSDDRKGFRVPLHNVTFVILTNFSMPDINTVEEAKGTAKYDKLSHLHAIRRRCEYKDINIDTMELWGYVADVVINEKICEKFLPTIAMEQKIQMLNWCYSNWQNMTERNCSVIEKMTKKIVQYPTNYLDIWKSEYISAPVTKGKRK